MLTNHQILSSVFFTPFDLRFLDLAFPRGLTVPRLYFRSPERLKDCHNLARGQVVTNPGFNPSQLTTVPSNKFRALPTRIFNFQDQSNPRR